MPSEHLPYGMSKQEIGYDQETLYDFPQAFSMNTRFLMISTSLVLGLAGVVALFAPENILAILDVPIAKPLPVLIQVMGALYFSMALMNWTAKDSIIGGIYARPVSLGNFAHFFSGTLVLAKYFWSNSLNIPILLMLVVYVIFALMFYWLVFRHTGIVVANHHRSGSE